MDPIKEAFHRAKQDIQEMKSQIISLTEELAEIKSRLLSPADPNLDNQSIRQTNQHTFSQINSEKPSNQHINPTHNLNKLDNLPSEALKTPNLSTSIGNEGVPTDRQTNQQTDNKPPFSMKSKGIIHFSKVSELLSSLDTIKKDLRTKFKRLTGQEMLVFSTIYQLEEQDFVVDYPLISKKLSLSESSIRDYVQRIIRKGIPLEKTKENNKKIILTVSPGLKQIASLSTITQLREL